MISWKNLDTLAVYDRFMALKGKVDLAAVMAGKSGAERVAAYNVPMPEGFTYNFTAKAVDDEVLSVLRELAKEPFLPGRERTRAHLRRPRSPPQGAPADRQI